MKRWQLWAIYIVDLAVEIAITGQGFVIFLGATTGVMFMAALQLMEKKQ